MATSDRFQPLQRFQLSTQDENETEEFVRQMWIGGRIRFVAVSGDARFSATVAEAGGIAADDIRATVDYSAMIEPFSYFFSFAVRRGRIRFRQGREEIFVPTGTPSFYPLGVPLDVEAADLDVRTLRLPLARLETVAGEIAGIAPTDLRFEAATPVSPGMARHWSAMIDLAGSMLLAENSPMEYPLLAEELTRTAAVTALHTFPNTAMTVAYERDPGWVEPAAVRRAVGYIQAHADQPITLTQIAAAAGVTGRALQYAFRRHYAITPTGYLRRVRLEHAEQELRTADPGRGLTVADVARRWGWASPSQFTVAYRQQFGITPSGTLRMR